MVTALRKSTSGGAAMYGWHCIRTWSSTQQTIALSSGEAELYALVKVAAQAKGLCSMLSDFGIGSDAQVFTDASAAVCMIFCQGLSSRT